MSLQKVVNFLSCCLLILFSLMSLAQAEVNNLYLERLTVKDGLSQGTVSVLMQDQKGYIWIGTDNGINIYDGYTVKPLLGPDSDFASYSVAHLLEDSEGLIWITLWDKGLFSYDPKKNTYEKIKDSSFTSTSISGVIQISTNDYLIITDKAIIQYDQQEKSYQSLVDLSNDLSGKENINHASVYENYLYISTRDGGFVADITSGSYKKLPAIKNSPLYPETLNEAELVKTYYMQVHNNKLYLGTNDGIFNVGIDNIDEFFHDKNVSLNYHLLIPHASVWSAKQEGNDLFFVAEEGLFQVNLLEETGAFLFSPKDAFDNIGETTLQAILIDTSGLLWLGSNAVGVYIWDPKLELVENYKYLKGSKKSLSNSQIMRVFEDTTSQNLWVGTSNGLNLINLDAKSVEHFLHTPGAKTTYIDGNIYDIGEDNKGRLWLNTALGLRIFDKKTRKLVDLPFSNEVNEKISQPDTLVYINGLTAWFASPNNFFSVNLVSEQLTEYPIIVEELGENALWSMLGYLPNRPNELLLSTNKELIGFDHKANKLNRLYQYENIGAKEWTYFDSWLVDKNNVLWLALSSKGLIGLDADTLEQKYFFSSSNSILENNIYGLNSDKDGDIWISSHNGIFLINADSLHMNRFDVADGLVGTEFNGGAAAKLSNGLLAYGAMEGLSLFDPLVLKNKQKEITLNVEVTNVALLSRDLITPLFISNKDEISINYDDVGVRVDFSTFNYAETDNIQYKYQLLGNENINYPLTLNNHIIFPTLPSGDHTLKIQAQSPYNGKLSNPTFLKFKVSYAPWASPTAYTIYTLLAISIYGYFMRKRHIQRQQLLNAHEEVKFRENRLQLALTGSNSEVWDWQSQDNLMFGKRMTKDLGFKDRELSYSFTDHVNLIHPEDRDTFLSKWQSFLTKADFQESFEYTYRMHTINDTWLWYKDLGKIVAVDKEGIPSRVTGSYTNITQSRVAEVRAQYYGDAFKQTSDWVLIVNQKMTKATANDSLRSIFNLEKEEFKFDADLLGVSNERKLFYTKLFSTLKEDENWRGDELVITPSGEEFHVIVNVTVSKNNNDDTLHYICVFTDITAQKTAEKELRLLANYDHLTGLPNRSLLLERIQHAMDYANRKHQSIGLFFIDLDRFKQINDSLGHDAGDLLLKEITARLTKVLRADDTVARIGGDEFVVLLESYSGNNQLSHIAQKIINIVERPIQLNNNVVSVGASIGISLYPDDAGDSNALLRNADVAMYHAKQQGRNNFQFFTEHMNQAARARLTKESNLKFAVTNDEFFNVYQPVIDAFTGKAVGVEMLLRWQFKDKVVSPFEFIELAEELGLIIALTDSALHRGLQDLIKWRELRENFYLSVNLSAIHFIKDSLVPFISGLLDTYNLPPSALKIEVTESAFISDPEKAIETMNALSEMGVILALDDFGTGFSSLSYLKKLPLDIIKIDRSFVSGIGMQEADEAIVDATIVLADSLNMQCIAEGVETQEQLDYLAEKSCHYIQGFLYYKPMQADEVTRVLNEDSKEVTATVNKSVLS